MNWFIMAMKSLVIVAGAVIGAVGQGQTAVSNQADPLLQVPIHVTQPGKLAFLSAAHDRKTAIATVKAVSRFSGCRLWLETTDRDVIAAALDEGKASDVKVGLVVRPWRNAEDPSDSNPVNERDAQAAMSVSRASSPVFGTCVAASRPALNLRWKRLLEAVSAPGLTDVMLLDTPPLGIVPDRNVGVLDPKDTCHGFQVRDENTPLAKESAHLAADKNAIEHLVWALSPKLRYIEPWRNELTTSSPPFPYLEAWKRGDSLPACGQFSDLCFGTDFDGYDRQVLVSTPTGDDSVALRVLLHMSTERATKRGTAMLLVDLQKMPTSQIGSVLLRWFGPAQ